MAKTQRTTIYLEPKVHRALKVKAALNGTSFSELVNDAVRESLREDALDLEALRQRRHQPRIPFQRVLAGLKRRRGL